MKVLQTDLSGLLQIIPTVFEDSRGYFFEAYNSKVLSDNNIEIVFQQDNQSKSQYGVIRGLHYQLAPHAQTKLVRVLKGSIFDVAVDIRKGSPTFGKVFGLQLDEFNKKQLFIPQGFAHGFSVLSEEAIVMYKCDNLYHKDSERGIRFNDSTLSIDWKIPMNKAVISEKDHDLPEFKNAEMNFVYRAS